MEWKFDSGGAIYAQIVAKLKEAIASGVLAPGTRLPAVRELALEAGVNPNTVQRALTELERDGLVYTIRTSGRFVTEDRDIVESVRRGLAERNLADFIAAMSALGYTGTELRELLAEYISEKGEE